MVQLLQNYFYWSFECHLTWFFCGKVHLNGFGTSVVEELQGLLFFLSNFVSLRKTKQTHYVGQKKENPCCRR